jgi:hypothetical protein
MSTQNKRTNTKQRRQTLRCGRRVRPFDSRALDWLSKHSLSLTCSIEVWDDHVSVIWWRVTKGNMSISGHPLGTPRAAIKAAMRNLRPNA